MAISFMTNIHCAGALFLAKKTQRFLFLLRSQPKTQGLWGIAGGKQEPIDETNYQALLRECSEELGVIPQIIKTLPIERYTSHDEVFNYNTYVIIVEDEFTPTLNSEHWGYCWVNYDHWPRPLHQGLRTTLSNRTTRAKLETVLSFI